MDFYIASALVVIFVIVFTGWMLVSSTKPYDAEEEKTLEMPTPAELKKMTKVKLDEWAKENGIELDRRQTKANMIAELEKKR